MSCNCEDIIIEVSEEGIDGNGIASIELLSESGLTKTYRINFTNGSHFDYSLSDGNGIARIEKTSTAGLVDTYTIYMTDGVTTYTFTVTNGKDGEPGVNTWGNIEGDINDQTDLKEALDLKADKADSYTKDELDGIFDGIDNALSTKADKTDVYTKTQADNLLSAKANTADLGALATMDAIDYTSDKLTNKPTLGALASKDTVNYETEVTNKPTLGTMAAEDAADYYDKDATDALLDEKADIIVTSASASLVHLTDAAPMPVKALSVAIDPVQDLHGYANPWPAGGGVNLLPVGGSFDTSHNDIRFQSDGNGKYTISGTPSNIAYYNFEISEITLPAGDIYLHLLNSAVSTKFSFALLNGNTQIAYASANTASRIVKLEALSGATIDTLRLYVANDAPELNLSIQPMLMLTNTASSYAPYSNVCPITGHSSAVVARTGRNLWEPFGGTNHDITFTPQDDGTVKASGTFSGATGYVLVFKDYSISALGLRIGDTLSIKSSSNSQSSIRFLDASNTMISQIASSSGSLGTGTIPTGTKTLRFIQYLDSNTHASGDTIDATVYYQLEIGSTVGDWEPYTESAVTISLGEERYGGTLDVLTGELTVDRISVTLTNSSQVLHYNTNAQYGSYGDIATDALIGNTSINVISDSMKGVSYNNRTSDSTIDRCYIDDTGKVVLRATNTVSITSANELFAHFTGAQLVYKLATPQTVTISPATLNLLKGENNLWSDTGDTSVTYRADTKLYIDGKLAAAVAELQALILEH